MSNTQVVLSLDGKTYVKANQAVFHRYVAGNLCVTTESPNSFGERIVNCVRKNAFQKDPIWIDTGISALINSKAECSLSIHPNLEEISEEAGHDICLVEQLNKLAFLIETLGNERDAVWADNGLMQFDNQRLTLALESALLNVRELQKSKIDTPAEIAIQTDTLSGIVFVKLLQWRKPNRLRV